MNGGFDYEAKVWGGADVSLRPTSLGALRLRYCLEALRDTRGRVVELGCGAGAFARAIRRRRPDLDVVGLDLSARSLQLASAAGLTRLVRGDVERLPIRDASADAVVFFDVLEHVAHPRAMLEEAARVLRPGAVLHALVPCEGSPYTLHGMASRLGYSPKERYGGHIQRFTPTDLRGLLREAGLRLVRWRWSGHYLTQAADLAYFTILAWRGRNVDASLETIASRSGGPAAYALGAAVKIVALAGYAESSLLRALPAVGAHLTCVRER